MLAQDLKNVWVVTFLGFFTSASDASILLSSLSLPTASRESDLLLIAATHSNPGSIVLGCNMFNLMALSH